MEKNVCRNVWATENYFQKDINSRKVKGKIVNNKLPLYTAHINEIFRE